MLAKLARTRLFFERLGCAPSCATAAEALEQLSEIMNAIEDEHTNIPYNPAAWEADGRLYPPQADSRRDVPGCPDVVRYRSRSHNTWIARNGAVRITSGSQICLEKPGRNGRTVSDLLPWTPSGI